jgi:hypothetical protein
MVRLSSQRSKMRAGCVCVLCICSSIAPPDHGPSEEHERGHPIGLGSAKQFRLSDAKHYLWKSLDDLQKSLKATLSDPTTIGSTDCTATSYAVAAFNATFLRKRSWNGLPEPVAAVAFIVEAAEVPNSKVDGHVVACHRFRIRIDPVDSG